MEAVTSTIVSLLFSFNVYPYLTNVFHYSVYLLGCSICYPRDREENTMYIMIPRFESI